MAASLITVPGVVVLWRNHATHHNENIVTPEAFEFFAQRWYQRQMAGRQRAGTNEVDVVFDCLTRRFLRGLK